MWKKIRDGVGHAHGSSPRGWGRGESEPTRSQPLAAPSLSQANHSYTPRRSRHTWGRLLYGEADSIPHEEEGGGWDMLDRDVECRRRRGYAGEGCGMRKEVEAGM